MNIWTSAILRTQIYVNVERKKLRVTDVTTNLLECIEYETGREVMRKESLKQAASHTLTWTSCWTQTRIVNTKTREASYDQNFRTSDKEDNTQGFFSPFWDNDPIPWIRNFSAETPKIWIFFSAFSFVKS